MSFDTGSEGKQPAYGGPLSGLRVVDATHMLSGPYCTWIMAELGADIIKVERPGTGDYTRGVRPLSGGQSIYFMSVNRGKRSIEVDFKSEDGKHTLRELLKSADIFVENNRAGVMDRLGFGYEATARLNPRLIHVAISGFGQTGPYRHKPAFDLIVQALSGMMSITGEENGPPARIGASLGDISASLFGVIGALSALEQRRRTGRGDFVDVSMLDCQVAILENAVARVLNARESPRRLGSRHPLIAPFQAFATADKPIVVCVDTDSQWRRLCRTMGLESLVDDPRFPDGSARADEHAALESAMQPVFAQRTRADWLSALEAADIPCSPINSIAEALNDPQVVYRNMIFEVPSGSGQRFVRIPIVMKNATYFPPTPPPQLGEHTEEILSEVTRAERDKERRRRKPVV